MKSNYCASGRIHKGERKKITLKDNIKWYKKKIKELQSKKPPKPTVKEVAMLVNLTSSLASYKVLIPKWTKEALRCKKDRNVSGLCFNAECYNENTPG